MKHYQIIFIFILPLLLTACFKKDTLHLLEHSAAAGNVLADYYEQLIQYTIETWELEAFYSSLRGIDFPREQQLQYQAAISHLQERKKLIRTFVKLLAQLKKLVNRQSSTRIRQTVTELAKTMNNIQALKDQGMILPADIMGDLSGDLLELVLFFQTKHFTKTLKKTLDQLRLLFENEKPLYLAIIEERNLKSMLVVNYMIDHELVIPWSLIESAPGTVGLKMAVSRKPARELKDKAALKKVVQVKYFRMTYLVCSAQEELSRLLIQLTDLYTELISGKKMVFESVFYLTAKASHYVAEINAYRKQFINNPNPPDGTIIYRANQNTRVFHRPGCRHYDNPNCTISFTSREQAIKNGYLPCKNCQP